MNDLLNEIEKLIADYYEEEFGTYKFKSSEAEENVLFLVDDLKQDVRDLICDANLQIECELNDSTVYVPDRDIIELDKYRI